MQFTKLRLVGFKSFVEPMEFFIEPGLNGVVGPNGCGKSNLVEALRWVMGENSYKNMRASGMEDVIFSGSNTRPSRNWAEVTLYLDNHDRSAPPQFSDADELQVSRRIEREKGSIYRINGRDVRARDVQLLFADQSTGARSPSMVGQGRIGELIAAKPQARRALLEEAAGIGGLHSRRHEAELRLRAAQANLERLDDVTGELATRIETLKRQVRQANRFKILSHEIRKNEAGLFYLRWMQAKSDEAETEAALNQAMLAVVEQAQIQAQAVRAQQKGQGALPHLREESARAAATLTHLKLGLKELEQEQIQATRRRSELMRLFEQLSRDEQREQALMAENDTILARLDVEEESLKASTQDFIIEQEERQAIIEEWATKLHDCEQELQILTDRKAEIMAYFEQNRHQIETLAHKKQILEQDILKTETTLKAVRLEMDSFDNIESMRATCQDMIQKLHLWEEEMVALDESVFEAREEAQTARETLNQIQMRLSAAQAEERMLEKILLEEEQGENSAVIDDIEVEKGFEHALGRALGDDLTVGLDDQRPIFWQLLPKGDEDPALPSGTISLLDHVKAPQILHRRLAQIGLVDADCSNEEVAHLQQHLKTGQILVNQQGALWRWDGLTMRADAPSPAARRLAQKNQLQDVKNLLLALMDEENTCKIISQKADEYLQTCENSARSRREDIKNQRQLYDEQRHALENLEKNHLRVMQQKHSLEETLKRLRNELEDLQRQQQEAQNLSAKLPNITSLNDDIEKRISRIHAYRLEWQQIKAQAQAATQTQTQNLHRLDNIALERKNWLSRMENARIQLQDLLSRREEIEAELEEKAAVEESFTERRQSLLDNIGDCEALKQDHADRLAEAETAQTALDNAATKAIEILSARREARARSEERLNAATERRQDIERQITELLQQPPSALLQLAEFSLKETLPEMAKLEQALERAKIERERLGAVNLRAEAEAGEMSERYREMTTERDDVSQAVKKLRQAIQNLNHEGRERLTAAFERVNTQFQRLFTHLFGGGMAELQLIESDDPLEAGLEILARPPGKKPQTMTLLSGGEQALTATALIFAVFLTNPAPICVLDEVDAPLDDHNVERYCNLLDEMTRLTQTRFIVITHNPITMARMARLFGVTMGEQGVSQLVSVDLHQAEKIREAG